MIMCGLSALSASGRLSVIVALWPSTSYLMVSYGMLGSLRSSAVEVRWAALAEGGQALLEIRCTAGEFQVVELLVHGLVQRGVLAGVDGLLGQPERHRRPGGQPGQQLLGDVVQLGGPRRRRGSCPSRRRPRRSPSRRAAASAGPARRRPAGAAATSTPESGLKPRARNGSQNTASSVATVKSAARARLQPKPTAQPRTVHTTGSAMVCTSSIDAVWPCDAQRLRASHRGRRCAGLRSLRSRPPEIRGHPVRARAEVVACAANVDRRAVRRRWPRRSGRRPVVSIIEWLNAFRRGRTVEHDAQDRAVAGSPSPTRRRRSASSLLTHR